MSGLGRLFESVAAGLGRGRRGEELVADFVAAFNQQPVAYMAELTGFVGDAVRRLGLADWPSGRLGASMMGLVRLGERECLEDLAGKLAGGGAERREDEGLGWLGGPLFRGGRLVAYLRAAEEDGGKALAYLRLNIRSELSALRRTADPVGSALFDNLMAAAVKAADEGALALGGETYVLARGGVERPAEEHGVEAHRDVLAERGALEPFAEAARRNELRPEGQRNRPLRGEQLEAPLVEHNLVWADSQPAHPACEAVDLSALANALRPDFPQAESLRETAVAVDDDGQQLWDEAPPELATSGPGPLRAFFGAWRLRVEQAPGLSRGRRAKLLAIVDALEPVFMNSLGEPPPGWQAALREQLALKPQTFSDDWKLLRELRPTSEGPQ